MPWIKHSIFILFLIHPDGIYFFNFPLYVLNGNLFEVNGGIHNPRCDLPQFEPLSVTLQNIDLTTEADNIAESVCEKNLGRCPEDLFTQDLLEHTFTDSVIKTEHLKSKVNLIENFLLELCSHFVNINERILM